MSFSVSSSSAGGGLFQSALVPVVLAPVSRIPLREEFVRKEGENSGRKLCKGRGKSVILGLLC